MHDRIQGDIGATEPGLKPGGDFPLNIQKSPQMRQNYRLSYSDIYGMYICIARFYADDIPYSIGDFGPSGGWRRRGCQRHYLAAESAANTHFRGDFCVFDTNVVLDVLRNHSKMTKRHSVWTAF